MIEKIAIWFLAISCGIALCIAIAGIILSGAPWYLVVWALLFFAALIYLERRGHRFHD